MAEEIKSIIEIARKILPSASSNPDPQMALIGAMGGIPDTIEWLTFKISFLEKDDLKGLIEWQEYILDKAKEYCKEHGIPDCA